MGARADLGRMARLLQARSGQRGRRIMACRMGPLRYTWMEGHRVHTVMFNGLKRGVQLIADFLRMYLHAIERGNLQAIKDGSSIARQWLHETTNEAGQVALNFTVLAFGGSDPWKVSRQMLEKYKTEYPGIL